MTPGKYFKEPGDQLPIGSLLFGIGFLLLGLSVFSRLVLHPENVDWIDVATGLGYGLAIGLLLFRIWRSSQHRKRNP